MSDDALERVALAIAPLLYKHWDLFSDESRAMLMEHPRAVAAAALEVLPADPPPHLCEWHEGIRAELAASCPNIVTADEGTSYCRLAEESAARVARLTAALDRVARWHYADAFTQNVVTRALAGEATSGD
jgi:hypothetical protein